MHILFAVTDNRGKILRCGSCDESILSSQAADGQSVSVIEELIDDSVFYFRNGELVEYPTMPTPIHTFDYENGIWVVNGREGEVAEYVAQLKGQVKESFNSELSLARTKYVTFLPGQENIYAAKEAEAKAFLADTSQALSDFPFLQAEVGITAPDAESLAQIWLNMSFLWRNIASTLEAIRLSFNNAVESAATVEDAELVLGDHLEQLKQFG